MRLIFSRNRAAQLDLLLRSLDANAPADFTEVLWLATTEDGRRAYRMLMREHLRLRWREERLTEGFDVALRDALGDETVTFFCDDDVLYRPVPSLGADVLAEDDSILAFSLRLGVNYMAMTDADLDLWRRGGQGGKVYTYAAWAWAIEPPHDHGYPGSIDGHTFRTADVLRMIDGQTIENPLMLETILARRCHALATERPLMACYPEQVLVGVPVNTVADDQRRPHGQRHPQPVDELNARFLAGERIDLGALDFSGVDGCLHEIPFVWTTAVPA